MKKAIFLSLITLLAVSGQAQSKRLAAYYVSDNDVTYSLNFFTNGQSYFVYTSATGKQITFQPAAGGKKGEYQFTKTGEINAALQVKNPGDEFPEKLKGSFTLDGKTIKLVFRKDNKGIVD